MITVVGSWRGVGATTAALALAASLSRSCDDTWLVEADPAGGVLSGRIRFHDGMVGGLERVAFPVEPADVPTRASAVAHQLGALRVVSAPADPFRAHACHRPRSPWASALETLGTHVVVDIGRVRVGTPVWPVVEQADVVLVVTTPEVAAVVSSVEWLRDGGRVAGGEQGLPDGVGRLLVVDAPGGVGFPRHRLEQELAAELVGWLPWDVAGVEQLHRGEFTPTRLSRRGGVLDAASDLAQAVTDVMARREAVL